MAIVKINTMYEARLQIKISDLTCVICISEPIMDQEISGFVLMIRVADNLFQRLWLIREILNSPETATKLKILI